MITHLINHLQLCTLAQAILSSLLIYKIEWERHLGDSIVRLEYIATMCVLVVFLSKCS